MLIPIVRSGFRLRVQLLNLRVPLRQPLLEGVTLGNKAEGSAPLYYALGRKGLQHLAAHGVEIRTHTRIMRVDRGEVTVESATGVETIPADRIERLTAVAHHVAELVNITQDSQQPYVGSSYQVP